MKFQGSLDIGPTWKPVDFEHLLLTGRHLLGVKLSIP